MKQILKKILRKTPFYPFLKSCQKKIKIKKLVSVKWQPDDGSLRYKYVAEWQISHWRLYGRPVPPLKIIEQEIARWQLSGRPVPALHIIKQQMLIDYSKKFGLGILIETGTFFGDMVEAMRSNFDYIYSIELDRDLYRAAKKRFKKFKNIELVFGDSSAMLKGIISKLNKPSLFWLDGHYCGELTAKGNYSTPIYAELEQIFNSPVSGHMIIIDDARCFETYPSYPKISELTEFAKSKNQNIDIAVQDDCIRIVPKQ